MTRKEKEEDIEKKVLEFIEDSHKHMIDNVKRAITCGAVDVESHNDNYIIPRVIFLALLKEEAFQYKFHCIDKKEQRKRESEVESTYAMM